MAVKPKLGSGGRFKALSGKVAASFKKKGMSPAAAKKAGAAVAAKAGIAKYGKKKMTKMAVAGKKAAPVKAKGRAMSAAGKRGALGK